MAAQEKDAYQHEHVEWITLKLMFGCKYTYKLEPIRLLTCWNHSTFSISTTLKSNPFAVRILMVKAYQLKMAFKQSESYGINVFPGLTLFISG
jgi:hypothetical protein